MINKVKDIAQDIGFYVPKWQFRTLIAKGRQERRSQVINANAARKRSYLPRKPSFSNKGATKAEDLRRKSGLQSRFLPLFNRLSGYCPSKPFMVHCVARSASVATLVSSRMPLDQKILSSSAILSCIEHPGRWRLLLIRLRSSQLRKFHSGTSV